MTLSTDRDARPPASSGHPGSLVSNIRVQALASFLGGIYRGGLAPVWQPFVLSLGASMRLLGFLESLGGWSGIVSSLMQLVGGWLADRVGRKPILVLASLFTALSMGFYALAAWWRWWPLLVPGVVLAGMGLLAQAARSSLTAESVHEEGRGRAYSLTMFAYIAPGVVSSVLGGWIAQRWGYLPIMAAGFFLEGVVLVALVRFLHETHPRALQPSGRARPAGLRTLPGRARAGLRRLWRLLLPLAGDAFAWSLGGSLLFGILRDHLGFTTGQLGWVNASFSLAWAILQLPAGRWVERYGCKRFLVLAEGLGVGCVLTWLLWPTFVGVLLSYALLGVTAALWVPAQLTLLAGSFEKEERGRAMGVIFTVQSLARFPAPYLAALLYDWKGYSAPLLAGGIGVVLVTVLLALLVQDPTRRPNAEGQA